MEILKIFKNEDEEERYILKKGDYWFLVAQYRISGTCYKNYVVCPIFRYRLIKMEDIMNLDIDDVYESMNARDIYEAFKEVEEYEG